MLFVCRPKVLHKHCLQFLLGVKMAPRETEDNAYAKFWGDKQRALWHVMVFLEWSICRRLSKKKLPSGNFVQERQRNPIEKRASSCTCSQGRVMFCLLKPKA